MIKIIKKKKLNVMKKIESRRKTEKEPNQILEFIKKKFDVLFYFFH